LGGAAGNRRHFRPVSALFGVVNDGFEFHDPNLTSARKERQPGLARFDPADAGRYISGIEWTEPECAWTPTT
jgi:hypothetical protein